MYEDIFFDISTPLEVSGLRHGYGVFLGKWEDKHWMNTPEALYCGDTDNCGTGPYEAPCNVALDDNANQVIYRQPVNLDELSQVWQAAWADPFSGYGADGNLHWTYETVKGWWAEQRREIEQEVRRLHVAVLALGANKNPTYHNELEWWLGYLRDSRLYQYLQVYAFFLDNGRIPMESDRLPEL